MQYGTFICLNCGWVGLESEVPIQRDGDSYAEDTQFWRKFWRNCPKCGLHQVEETE